MDLKHLLLLFLISLAVACVKDPPAPDFTPPDSSYGLIYTHILAEVGVSDVSPRASSALVAAGAHETRHGRLVFPPAMVESAVAEVPSSLTLCGQDARHDLTVSGSHVYTGTGGAAPNVVDSETGEFRPATLRHLFDAARLVDALDHVHFFSRSLVATDIADARELDLYTALACIAGTSKHVMVSASDPRHVAEITKICYRIAGSETAFRARPFLSLNVNHAVPPLRLHAESCDVMIEAIDAGIPVHANVFGQLGASSPVTIAGSVAQTTAETLAGVMLAWATKSDALVIAGPRPMITDLRTGAMSGGSGEQALATSAAIEMMRFYNLPHSVIAGATDSKSVDIQAGYERALCVTQAVHSGAHLVTQACGMQAGLMGVALESYVIDNDLLGAVLRSATPIEINTETLALDAVAEAVQGDGHFLGDAQTYARMKSDFLYPDMADRSSIEAWTSAGQPDLREAARERVRSLLAAAPPAHADTGVITGLCNDLGLDLAAHEVSLGPS